MTALELEERIKSTEISFKHLVHWPMSTINKILTAALFLLVGLFAGLNWQLNQQREAFLRAQVKQTQIFTANDARSERLFDPNRPHLTEVANALTPSVVFIESRVSARNAVPKDGNHDFDENFWRRFSPRRTTAAGSGIVISSDGYILTNNHVIDGADEDGIKVHLNNRREYQAILIGTDPTTDLAVIKIEEDQLEPVIFGNSDAVQIGDWVLAIGNPLRLRSTVTAGIVSALGRSMDIINSRLRVESFIQTDAAINQGNSGGALVNVMGELIGVNTAIATRTGSYQGYGFAVPSNLAKKVATDLIETGKVRRALIGVSINSVSFERAEDLGLKRVAGVDIIQVARGGAADLAGIEAGDVILAVDGMAVDEVNNLQERIALHLPGDMVELQIFRDGEILIKTVELQAIPTEEEEIAEEQSIEKEEMPEEHNFDDLDDEPFELPAPKNPDFGLETYAFDKLGFTLMELDRTSENKGVSYLVSKVDPTSIVWEKGLRSGQTIIKVQKKRPESLNQIIDLLSEKVEKKEEVTLLVERADGRRIQLRFRIK